MAVSDRGWRGIGMRKGQETRERLLEIAERAVLQKGFGATSIDEIIAEAEITKSGFFYHFKDKNELALALVERYIEQDDAIFDDLFARATDLSDDPLHAFLIGLKLLAEMMDNLPEGHPGCLVATYAYQERLFDPAVIARNRDGLLSWRMRFRGMLDDVVRVYPPRDEVDLDALADMVSSTIEGGIVLSKAIGDPRLLGQQIMLLRSYLRLLFQPTIN
jgi:TetR/AcrR family transcriptional regulator, transcriptional repressor for nem operon